MSLAPEIRSVEWVDSAACTGRWTPVAEVDDFGVSTCKSVGYVLREDAAEVVLVQSIDDRHGNLDSLMAIPKVAIRRSETIRPAEELPPARFAHNVLAHPLLWAWPRVGEWLHRRTEP